MNYIHKSSFSSARPGNLIFFLGLFILLSSCSQQIPTFTPDPTSQSVFQPTSEPTETPIPSPQLTSLPLDSWVDPSLPAILQDQIAQLPEFNPVPSKAENQIIFSSTGAVEVGSWTYLFVGPFYAQLEDLQLTQVQEYWNNGPPAISGVNQLLLGQETKDHLSQIWGEPSPEGVTIAPSNQITETIWNYPGSFAIIPFDYLNPSFKVIPIDEIDPLSNTTQDQSYSLTFPVYITVPDSYSQIPLNIPYLTNFDRSKLTSIALTGVTALVRDTAAIMEEKGILYPAEDVRDLLADADLTHINNEVPFAADCPPPDSNQESLYFCSSDDYIELLKSIGTDIIELSGDHFADYGPEAMFHSLDLYRQNGFLTYGGGENLQAGLDPLIIEHNGNRFAFIGCNSKPHEKYATASSTNPGASRCDFEWMLPEISRLSEDGYLVIATMQHEEVDSFFPVAIQLYDFRNLSDAGAVIVSGSQAHHPQGFELSLSTFIHYGLGNLFFDQWYLSKYFPEGYLNMDKSTIDLHYFYDGKYINTRLVPLQFIDNARPREMSPEEKTSFLTDLFKASKWNENWIDLYQAGYFIETENQ